MEFKNVNKLYNEAKKYELVSSAELVNLFKDAHVFFPDFINRFILLNVLKKHVFNDLELGLFPIEFTYKLKNYNYFSVYLLINTVEKYNLKIDAKEYKNMFMRFYFKNQKKFKITQSFEEQLLKYESKVGPSESILDTIKLFQELFYTPKGYLDGINLSLVKDSINATFNISDLEVLAKNNGVEIPKRLNKSELLSIISSRLLLTDEEKENLSKKPVSEIQIYSRQKGFKISADLKKADMVEYLVYSLGKYHEDTEKDLYNYDILVENDETISTFEQTEIEHLTDSIPVSSNLVESTPVVDKKIEEEKIEVKEEKVEEVKEKTNISKELKEDMDNVLYYDTQVDQEIREIIEKYYSKKKNRDRFFKTIIVILLILILAVTSILLLKVFNVF